MGAPPFPNAGSPMDVGSALVVVALIVSAAYVYAPIERIRVARRLRVALPAGAVAPEAEAVPAPPIELPDAVLKICEQESEMWAQYEQGARARRLYAEHGDWNVVAGLLEQI